jgi:PAS domain S-box-containing protein
VYFHWRAVPEFGEDGEIASVITIARDITNEKQVEDELRRSRRAFRDLTENAYCGIARLDTNNRFMYANPVSRELFVTDHEELLGKSIGETSLTKRAAGILPRILRTVNKSAQPRKLKIRDGSGDIYSVFELVLVPELSSEGKVESVLMISHNITESELAKDDLRKGRAESRRQLVRKHNELVEAETKLLQAERLSGIGTLAATVAHELRNPLGVIQTAVYNIRRKRKNPDIDRHIASIEKKVEESDRIISNLLSYSRLKQPILQTTDLSAVIRDAVSDTSNQTGACGTSLRMDLDSINGLEAHIDPDQVREVMSNIINNACQALGENGGVVEIGAQITDGESVEVVVKDNGGGMDKDTLARAFDPFFTTRSKGTGLGLTICRDIMRLHGGNLAIESKKGHGTTVTMTFPMK